MASGFRAHLSRLLLLALCATVFPGAGFIASTSTAAEPGSVIKGRAFSTLYYFAPDGMRYVFPNENTYFTWYDTFTQITQLSDDELGQIQIGGNVTYKPGEKLVKITTDPRTYAVEEGGMLRWIESEGIAYALYGQNWASEVDDLPDAFFTNYTLGPSIQNFDDFNVDAVRASTSTIAEDKGIFTPVEIRVTASGYAPVSVTIAAGQSVRFVNNDTVAHTVTADTLLWGSGTLAPGDEFVHTFRSAGTYTFFDSYNSRNSGAVFVTLPNE